MRTSHTLTTVLALMILALPSVLDAATVKALRVVGQVEIVDDATGRTAALRPGQVFGAGTTIVTHVESSAILVFSNGSSLHVAPNSSVRVDSLFQEAFPPNLGEYETLPEEPSRSESRLHLNYGEVTSESKLREGSTFDIATNVGVAGIRGSIVQVTVDRTVGPDGEETVAMVVMVFEAGDETVGIWSGEVSQIAEFTPLAAGTTAEIVVDDDTGEVVTTPLSPEQTEKIMTIVSSIQTAKVEASTESPPAQQQQQSEGDDDSKPILDFPEPSNP